MIAHVTNTDYKIKRDMSRIFKEINKEINAVTHKEFRDSFSPCTKFRL